MKCFDGGGPMALYVFAKRGVSRRDFLLLVGYARLLLRRMAFIALKRSWTKITRGYGKGYLYDIVIMPGHSSFVNFIDWCPHS